MVGTVILVFVGLVLLLLLAWLVAFFRAARDVRLGRNIEKARKRMKDPVSGSLTVTGMTEPSPEAIWAMAEITGVVKADGLEPCAVQRVGMVRTALWPKPGQVLPVVVDRANPDSFVVEWTKVKSGSQAARNEAQALAAAMRSEGE